MGLFDRFKANPKNIPVYPEYPCTIPQREVDPEILEPALENPLLEQAIGKLGKSKRKIVNIRDARAADEVYGKERIKV